MPDNDSASQAGEQWLAIPGYEGFYEVSASGQVRSLHFDPPRPVATYLNKDGYRLVTLTREPQRRRIYELHPLVCSAFNGPKPSEQHECDHIDRDRSNCAAHNLQWLTLLANRQRRNPPRKRKGYASAVGNADAPEGQRA